MIFFNYTFNLFRQNSLNQLQFITLLFKPTLLMIYQYVYMFILVSVNGEIEDIEHVDPPNQPEIPNGKNKENAQHSNHFA